MQKRTRSTCEKKIVLASQPPLYMIVINIIFICFDCVCLRRDSRLVIERPLTSNKNPDWTGGGLTVPIVQASYDGLACQS